MAKLQRTKSKELPYAEELIQLGLSRAESLIYVYLLERGGETGASKIAIGTGMHRQQVYLALPGLIEKGIVEEVKGGVAKYRSRPPQALERLMRRKMVETEAITAQLQKISKVGYEQEFEAVVGIEACRIFEVERARSMKEGEEQLIIGSERDEYVEMMGDIYARTYVPILEKKKIVTKYLAPTEQARRGSIIDERQQFQLQVLPGLSTGPVATMIQGDSLIMYVNVHPATIYVIKSQKVADGYRKFFDMLWHMAGVGEKSNH